MNWFTYQNSSLTSFIMSSVVSTVNSLQDSACPLWLISWAVNPGFHGCATEALEYNRIYLLCGLDNLWGPHFPPNLPDGNLDLWPHKWQEPVVIFCLLYRYLSFSALRFLMFIFEFSFDGSPRLWQFSDWWSDFMIDMRVIGKFGLDNLDMILIKMSTYFLIDLTLTQCFLPPGLQRPSLTSDLFFLSHSFCFRMRARSL